MEMAPVEKDKVEGNANEDDKMIDGDDGDLNIHDIGKIKHYELIGMESEPFFWAEVVTRVPFCCFFFSFLVFAAFTVACIFGKLYEFNQPHPRDYLIWRDPIVKNWDKSLVGQEYIEKRDSR